jgi:KipI family sensor histidine kinase inhibitor
MHSIPPGEIRRVGDRALIVGTEDAAAATRMVRALRELDHPAVREVVAGLSTVLIEFERESVGRDELDRDGLSVEMAVRAALADPQAEVERQEGRLHQIPCIFDGPDLGEVAERAGCSPADVVGLLTGSELHVVVVGFSPGFAYLDGLAEPLRLIGRRRTPRPSVPAGSVALANGHAAVYPTESPGGWQLIGRTTESFFSPRVPPYARLAPGDRVQFIGVDVLLDAAKAPEPAWSPPAGSHAVFEVQQPGLRTVLQDGGRRGVAGIGVPAAGPADHSSFTLANRLVGNDDDAGALEVTASGPTLRALAPAFVAVVGAAPVVQLEDQPMTTGKVFPVAAGQTLTIGAVRHGLRTYVAVAGGLVGEELFGSIASDQLSGLGPGPLCAGTMVWAAELRPPLGDHLREDALPITSHAGSILLRVIPGPHFEQFPEGFLEMLCGRTFVVADESNRVGLRLTPPGERVSSAGHEVVRPELDSQGAVTGAVQVPPDGRPVVLLPDHATLGGYPIVAVVLSADLGLLGQCGPGTEVRLVPVDHAEAARASVERRRQLDSAVVGHYPLAVE